MQYYNSKTVRAYQEVCLSPLDGICSTLSHRNSIDETVYMDCTREEKVCVL